MGRFLRVAWLVQAGILLLTWPVAAQIKTGEVSSSLNGTISSGYTADYGNTTSSDHGWTAGGVANYSGSFHSPNFLSFNASAYLNQSRANSDFQSISDASGVTASANIFGGSRFPGAISYSKAIDSEGSYAVPGVANYVTHGNSDAFGINWSENLPDLPTFAAGFLMGNSQYSVYGTNDNGTNAFHSLNFHSSYSLDGFNMGAYYGLGGGHSLIPEVVSGAQDTETHQDNSDYGFNVSHRLPLRGTVSGAINRSNWDSDYQGNSTSGTIDLFTFLASMHPTNKLTISGSANYSDNLSGQLTEAVVAAGGAVPADNSNDSSNSMDLMATLGYALAANLQTSAYMERRTQLFEAENYGVTSFGGSASYAHKFLDGNFNAALTLTGNSSDQTGEDTLGFSTNENYSSEVRGWNVSGSFAYSQNVETLLVTYMSSSYSFSGGARRRWGDFNMSVGAGGSRTALTAQAGTANSDQSYNGSVGYGSWISANGSYNTGSGQALETGSGLVPVPVPSPTLSSSQVSLYGGGSYSLGISSTPAKGLLLSASYGKSTSNTSTGGVASVNENDEYNALIQYQVRKLNFTSGYSRLGQGFSGTGTPPEVISSFYFGVSRWFNFF